MSSRLNDIDLNSDAVFNEQDDDLNDLDRYRLVAANPGISDSGTLTDRVIGSGEEVKIVLDVSDKTVVRDSELGHLEIDGVGGGTLGDTNEEDKMRLVVSDKTVVRYGDAEIKGSLGSNLKLEGDRVEFRVNDLVWAKVRSHPWWPGQIFCASDASELAKKYLIGEDQLLIAFFGDQSFAWSDGSHVKSFQTNFSQMEKQSCLESFQHAVDCSLDEVSRRVQFGLSCRCLRLPKELSNEIKTQVVVNAGIRKESSRIEGKEDNHFSPGSFVPLKLVELVRNLAVSPHKEVDSLDFVIGHSQLLAFNRWRGYYDLPEFKAFHGLLDNDEFLQGSSSKKRKGKIHSDAGLLKKQKLVSDLMYENGSSSSKMKIDRTNTPAASKTKFSKVGESMRKIATQLVASSDSSPIIKKSKPNIIASPVEMLSQVRLAAEDPMNNNKTPNSFLKFFSDFRNSVCMERSSDRIIKTNGDDKNETVLFKHRTPINPEVQCEPQQQQHSPTALILNFTDLSAVPPVSNLNQIFSRFGPLDEAETEVMTKTKRAKVIFKRRDDAETAFSSAGKYKIFGPALISYRLTPQKSCPTKRSKRVVAA